MSEYDDALMLSKILERMAAQSLHLKDKIDSGLEIPSWAEYKLYNAYSSLGSALGTAYPGMYDEEKRASKVRRHPDGDLIKESGVLPEFLEKTHRDGFIDPRDDDFSKNQAFGRSIGVGLLPVMAGAGIGIGGNAALGAGVAGLGALAGYGMYRHKLRQFRELQAQGRNPVTGKMHDPERIERTRRWAQRARLGDQSAQAELDRQTFEDLGKQAAATATKTDPAKWEAAKREAKSKMGGKHSARAMQLATQIYKKNGGGYSGAKPTSQNNSLKKWTKQKWGYSGKDKPGQGGSGVYLPEKKRQSLKSTSEGRKKLRAASAAKAKATRKGEQYSSHGLAAGTSLKKSASYYAAKEAAASKDPRLARAGVSAYNQVKRTPGHPTKSHIVVAKEGDKVKTIRFGQQGVKTNQTAGQREAFKSRHRKNISRGRMSAAYWADKAKWSPKKTKDKDNPNWVKGS